MGPILLLAVAIIVSVFVLVRRAVLKRRQPANLAEDALKIRGGVLYVLGSNSKMECSNTWKKEDFVFYLQEMQALIAEHCPMVQIEALVIEPHVAVSLWQQGELTPEHIAAVDGITWSGGRPRQFTIKGWLGGMDLVVNTVTYYDSWEFRIKNHPRGIRQARPVPDLLAAASGEEFFPAQI